MAFKREETSPRVVFHPDGKALGQAVGACGHNIAYKSRMPSLNVTKQETLHRTGLHVLGRDETPSAVPSSPSVTLSVKLEPGAFSEEAQKVRSLTFLERKANVSHCTALGKRATCEYQEYGRRYTAEK